MNIWDDPDRVAELKAHIDDGLSGNRTADAMGLTIGQVTGRAERMGLKFKSVPGHNRRPAGGANRGSYGSKFMPTFGIAAKFPYRAAPPVVPEKMVEPLMLTFGQLNDSPIITQCRFPYGDDPVTMTYCGLVVDHDGCSWCRQHKRMMWQHSGVRIA